MAILTRPNRILLPPKAGLLGYPRGAVSAGGGGGGDVLDLTGYDYTSDVYLATPTVTDTDTHIVSLWFKHNNVGHAGANDYIFHFAGGRFLIVFTGSIGSWYIECWNSAPTRFYRADSDATIGHVTDGLYHHFLWAKSGTTHHWYIDGVEALNTTTLNNAGNTSLGSAIRWYMGAVFNFTLPMNGCISNVYANFSEYLDMSDAANRAKFITAGGDPVDPGADGSTPTGSSPDIWVPDGLPTTNAGTAGNFTLASGDGAVAC